MLVSGKNKFIQSPFVSEDELKKMVILNAEYFFGPSSFCLSKEFISTKNGFEAIPDGYVVDLKSRQWFIVNPNIAKHDVWSHIAPQVAKQLIAANRSATKQLLLELIVQQVGEDKNIMKKFSDEGFNSNDKKGVMANDIRGVLGEIFEKSPIIGMPIDSISSDLRAWAETLKAKVRLCIIRKYVENGNSENVIYEIPEEYSPEVGTIEESDSSESRDEYLKNTKKAKITKGDEKVKEKDSEDYAKSEEKVSEKIRIMQVQY